MITGMSYMGHHNPEHMKEDIEDIAGLGCKDLLLAAQENDFNYMTGKIEFFPELAEQAGLRPVAIFWGVLNLFGGGRSSQFLLECPEGRQVGQDGTPGGAGCYNNPMCVELVKGMIDSVASLGYKGYFVDEPTPLDCWCGSCKALFKEWYGADLAGAEEEMIGDFRRKAAINYVRNISAHCKKEHPALETQCCIMPHDSSLFADCGRIAELDNLGTDIYWVNNNRDVEEMRPIIRELAGICEENGKKHHQWLQCWTVDAGQEDRIVKQGRILLQEDPDMLYIWAYKGQIGTSESCDNPELAWEKAKIILQEAAG